jgi:hypothetical protein
MSVLRPPKPKPNIKKGEKKGKKRTRMKLAELRENTRSASVTAALRRAAPPPTPCSASDPAPTALLDEPLM